MGLLGTMATQSDAFTGAGIMLFYPLYASVMTIESPSLSTTDVQQWLMYWISLSSITLFELFFFKILHCTNRPQRMLLYPSVLLWVYVMKRMICMWLVLPRFNGAAYIYQNCVRQFVKAIEDSGDVDGGAFTSDVRKARKARASRQSR